MRWQHRPMDFHWNRLTIGYKVWLKCHLSPDVDIRHGSWTGTVAAVSFSDAAQDPQAAGWQGTQFVHF